MVHIAIHMLLNFCVTILLFRNCLAGFSDHFTAVWTPEHILPDDASNGVKIMLSQHAGAQFNSLDSFLYGSFSVKLKLIAGESAGTVCSFYLTSDGAKHDEIDFEFLGNETGHPYVLHTNVFANGVGSREQRIFLWFDPTADFHTYSAVWNHRQITWFVDDTPIRVYRNIENELPNSYPTSQPMVVAASIYDASSWATRGGAVAADWSYAPFTVNYKDFTFEACTVNNNVESSCTKNYEGNWWENAEHQTLDSTRVMQLRNVQRNYLIYNYCTDQKRYTTPPKECAYNDL